MAFLIYNHGFINIDQIRFARIERDEAGGLDQIAVFVQGTPDPLYLVGEFAEAAFQILTVMLARADAPGRTKTLAARLVKPKHQTLPARGGKRGQPEMKR